MLLFRKTKILIKFSETKVHKNKSKLNWKIYVNGSMSYGRYGL